MMALHQGVGVVLSTQWRQAPRCFLHHGDDGHGKPSEKPRLVEATLDLLPAICPGRSAVRQRSAQQPGREQQRQGSHSRFEKSRIGNGPGRDVGVEVGEHQNGTSRLQQQPECARHPAGLPCADPQRASTFKQPRNADPFQLKRQGNRHGDKADSDRQQTFAEQAHPLIAPPERPGGNRQIDRAKHHRRPGAGKGFVVDQAGLQSESGNRGAEQQR